jgi:hypothetical protein
MKHIILFSHLVLLSTILWAQERTCGYDSHTRNKDLDSLKQSYFSQPSRNQARIEAEPVNIPIQIHIIKNSNNDVPDLTDIQKNITELNKAFLPINVQFYQCNDVHYIVSDQYDTWDFLTSISVPQEYNNPYALDIFYVKTLPGACGVFSGFIVNKDHYIAIQNSCASSGVLIHEIGHYFGLDHTHDSYWGKELVDKSNCRTTGDRFCDTPADPNLQGKTTINCTYVGTDKDPNGASYQPSTNNFMSYTNHNCLSEFTTEQLDFMRYYLDSHLKPNYPYTCAPKPDLAGQLFTNLKSLKKNAVNEINFTITNYSTYTIPNTTLDYTLSLVNQFGDSAVIYTGKLTKHWDKYEKDSVKVQANVPALPDGLYRLVLTLDNEILETNNTSSIRVGVYSNTSLPDLHLTTIKQKTANAGVEYVHSYKIKNAGQVDSDQFSILFAISKDTKLSDDDIFTGPFYHPTMLVGDSFEGTQSLIFPNDPGKQYYIITVIDIGNVISELDETNNLVVDTISLLQYNNLSKPDVTIINWDFLEPAASTYMQDQFFTITARIENIGGGKTFLVPTASYISADATWDSEDILTFSGIERMYNNVSNSAWIRATIPANYPPGKAYILLVLDHKNDLIESNENNNVVAIPITVIANTQADMTPIDVTLSKHELALEEPFTITGTYKNLGFSTTSNWSVIINIIDTANYISKLSTSKYINHAKYYNPIAPNETSSKIFSTVISQGGPYNIQAGVYWMEVCASNTRNVGFAKNRCITLPEPVVVKEILTGIEEYNGADVTKVYPNPSKNYIVVESFSQEIQSVDIITIEGKFIKTVDGKSNHSLEINTHDLPLGLYTLRVKTNGGTITKKFTVLR